MSDQRLKHLLHEFYLEVRYLKGQDANDNVELDEFRRVLLEYNSSDANELLELLRQTLNWQGEQLFNEEKYQTHFGVVIPALIEYLHHLMFEIPTPQEVLQKEGEPNGAN